MSKAIAINEDQLFIDFRKLSTERKKEVADFIAYLKVIKVLREAGFEFAPPKEERWSL